MYFLLFWAAGPEQRRLEWPYPSGGSGVGGGSDKNNNCGNVNGMDQTAKKEEEEIATRMMTAEKRRERMGGRSINRTTSRQTRKRRKRRQQGGPQRTRGGRGRDAPRAPSFAGGVKRQQSTSNSTSKGTRQQHGGNRGGRCNGKGYVWHDGNPTAMTMDNVMATQRQWKAQW